jgi:hypothetical protein
MSPVAASYTASGAAGSTTSSSMEYPPIVSGLTSAWQPAAAKVTTIKNILAWVMSLLDHTRSNTD